MTKPNWVERIEARPRLLRVRTPITMWTEIKAQIRQAKIKQDIKQQKENENE